MKKYFFLAMLFLGFDCFSQSIAVDTTRYTIPQLVTDVLVNKKCVPVSNVKWRTGSNFGSSTGIGYFKNTNPSFPLSSGVILSTGNVAKAVGPNTTDLNDGNAKWTGDTDLETALFAAGIRIKSANATVLEFDFVPFSSNFDFRFIFASEEYGNFQCQFTDAFAFLLTETATGITKNLAVVPGTSDPISVTTIRDFLYNSSCNSANAQYFGSFNGGSQARKSATNFNGQTVLMSASTNSLIPNTNYHIKLVIADRQDNKSDSAIFLGSNSFNIGQNVLGPDRTIASNTAVCINGSTTIFSGLNPAIYSFSWTYNGNPIGGNTPNLTVDKPGVYGLTYTIISTGCIVTTDYLNVEYYPEIDTADPVDLFKCNQSLPSYTYDLSANTDIVKIAGTQVNYYSSLVDATSDKNQLPLIYNCAATNLPATIWLRIKNTTTGCFKIKSFLLQLTPAPIANKPADLEVCETGTGSNVSLFNINSQKTAILGNQSSLIFEVSFYASNADAVAAVNPINSSQPYTSENTTLFARIQGKKDPSCYSLTEFKLIVITRPKIDEVINQFVCKSYVLPALVNPGNYYSGPAQGLPMLNVGDEILVDKTIYIYSTNEKTPSCSSERSFDVKIISALDLNPLEVVACDQFTLPFTIFSLRYFTLPGGPAGGGTELAAGSSLSDVGKTTIYTYFSSTDIANPCALEGQFTITLYKTPTIKPIANVFECSSYDLPPLSVGNYYTYESSTGTYTPISSTIVTTTKVYVFATNAICRTPDTIFTVYIGSFGFTDVNTCDSYNLLPAPVGEYRDAPDGKGNLILPGLINKNITLYSYVSTALCVTDSFKIIFNQAVLSTPLAVTTCDNYLLPEQLESAKYYTLPGGPATPGNIELIPNIDSIKETSTIYIHKPSLTLTGCYNEKPLVININKKPLIDSRSNVEQCNSYELTPLKDGSYFDDPNGVNPLASGTIITVSNRIYIYATNPNDPSCFAENYFDITINGVKTDPIPTQLSYCGSFTFPVLPTPNNFYYDAPGGPFGGGKIIPAGTVVTAATVLPIYYIYYETDNRLNCSDEKSFSITITPRPVANPVSPIVTCDTFGANDGIFEFDLTNLSIRNQILQGQTPDANYTLTFYSSFEAANTLNSVSISNPSKYLNKKVSSESIWIRVANNTATVSCFDIVELKLIVHRLPNPVLLPEYFRCEDFATGAVLSPVKLDVGEFDAEYLFEWTLDGKVFSGYTNVIPNAPVGNYTLKITDVATLCSQTISTKVTKYAPYLEIVYSDAFDKSNSITVNVVGSGSENYEYQLDDLPFQDSPDFDNVPSGEHFVSVRDKNGHCNPASITVLVVNYPKYFTPNGDGYNDTWNISNLATTQPNTPILIYDRYGKFLKKITPATEGWNGMIEGQPLPTSDYWFTVNYVEKGKSKVFRSHFTLKR